MKLNLFWAGMLVLFTQAMADEIITTTGDIYRGTIISSSKESVEIQGSGLVKKIDHQNILKIIFTSADIITLMDGQEYSCKILRKEGDKVFVAAADGEKIVMNSKIKSADYNLGGRLEMGSLGETGVQYKNKAQNFVWTGDFKKNIFIGINLGSHYCALTDWRDQFVFEDGNEPGRAGFILGGAFGFVTTKQFTIGVAYDKFWGPKVKLGSSVYDRVYFDYYSAFIRLGGKYKKVPGLSMFLHAALGSLHAKERIADYQQSFEGTNSKIAPQFKFICEYFFQANTSITTEIGVLYADVEDLEVMGQPVPDYSLNFNGVTFLTGLNFHFPIH